MIDRIRALLGQPTKRRDRQSASIPRPEWLIVGLGNPGPRYARTRHNAGFRCLDRLAQRQGLSFDTTRFNADFAAGQIAGQPVWLLKPRTYMNASGQATAPALTASGLGPNRLLVIYDDLDLALGAIRIRKGGSAGGQNGMKSVIHALGTSDFPRIRVGVGRPRRGDPVDYLLTEFRPDEEPVVEAVCDRVAAAVEAIPREGIDAAMNQFNRRPD